MNYQPTRLLVAKLLLESKGIHSVAKQPLPNRIFISKGVCTAFPLLSQFHCKRFPLRKIAYHLTTIHHLPEQFHSSVNGKFNSINSKEQYVNRGRITSQRGLHKDTTKQSVEHGKSVPYSARAIVDASPSNIQPYMKLIRFDRPIGSWLLFLPCSWSISLATPAGCLPDPTILALFACGSFLMRGAGCTINDMWDKDFDAKVERTKDRPLACGQISSFQALSFLGLQLSASLAILLTFNWSTVILGASSMLLVVIYPLMKRFTYWPQAFLGLTFNWGALLGWSATAGSVAWFPALSLYAASLAWTLVYDTIYAHQDKEDDILIGVKSTALKFGEQTKPWLVGFSTLMLSGLTCTGMLCDQTWPYYTGLGMVAAHLAYQIYSVDLNSQADCAKTFRSNRNLGVFFWLCIMAGTLLKTQQQDGVKDTDKNSS